jgi:hypothetical protein
VIGSDHGPDTDYADKVLHDNCQPLYFITAGPGQVFIGLKTFAARHLLSLIKLLVKGGGSIYEQHIDSHVVWSWCVCNKSAKFSTNFKRV